MTAASERETYAAVSVYGYVSGQSHHNAAKKRAVTALTNGPAAHTANSSLGEIPEMSPETTAPYGISTILSSV